MSDRLTFELDDGETTTVLDVIGSKAVAPCPDCGEGALVLQSQGHGDTYERYLECSDEDCGRAFYRAR